MTCSNRRPRIGASLLCLVLTLGGMNVGAGAATIPANLLALRPVKAVSYQPSPDRQQAAEHRLPAEGVLRPALGLWP